MSLRPSGTRLLVLGTLLALAVAVAAGQRSDAAPWLGLALAAPLALPLRGILRGNRYTYAWSTLLVSAYIGLGLVEAIARPDRRVWAAGTLLLAFALFVALIAHLRISRPSA